MTVTFDSVSKSSSERRTITTFLLQIFHHFFIMDNRTIRIDLKILIVFHLFVNRVNRPLNAETKSSRFCLSLSLYPTPANLSMTISAIFCLPLLSVSYPNCQQVSHPLLFSVAQFFLSYHVHLFLRYLSLSLSKSHDSPFDASSSYLRFALVSTLAVR